MSGAFLDAAMVSRCLRAMSRRVGDGDVAALEEFDRLRHELDGHILDAVTRLRAEPWCYSWRQIGIALGVTPQAAAQRFVKARGAPGARKPGGQPLDPVRSLDPIWHQGDVDANRRKDVPPGGDPI
jgi:hypothetical protein